jgi:hypothetical protein
MGLQYRINSAQGGQVLFECKCAIEGFSIKGAVIPKFSKNIEL